MITTLIVLACLLAYVAPAIYAIRRSRDQLYREYFDKQMTANESRSKTDPNHSTFMDSHKRFSALYPNRREWCQDKNYKMPAEWILADYSWGASYARASQKRTDAQMSMLIGLAWPGSLAFYFIRLLYNATLGNLLEPSTMKKQRTQIDQSIELARKAKETLELADTFRYEDPSTFTLLRDTAVMMGEQAEEMRKLKVKL